MPVTPPRLSLSPHFRCHRTVCSQSSTVLEKSLDYKAEPQEGRGWGFECHLQPFVFPEACPGDQDSSPNPLRWSEPRGAALHQLMLTISLSDVSRVKHGSHFTVNRFLFQNPFSIKRGPLYLWKMAWLPKRIVSSSDVKWVQFYPNI